MEPNQLPPGSAGLTRRDFLKFLPMAGGALLLSGCGGTPASTSSLMPLPSRSSTLPPSAPPLTESTPTASLTPQPSGTYTLTLEPPSEYLPPVDGSYTTYTLPAPQFPGDKPLMQTLQERRSSREFRSEELPVPVLAALL
ncbi:MAG: twin-arginine translocation signal domain-containing protein, partial [Chloroflexi bacterium]|nr:twin-arginine translocation signal domain-containing protein [Chloroflexota bacterium]